MKNHRGLVLLIVMFTVAAFQVAHADEGLPCDPASAVITEAYSGTAPAESVAYYTAMEMYTAPEPLVSPAESTEAAPTETALPEIPEPDYGEYIPGSELIFGEPMYIYSVAPTEIALPEIPEPDYGEYIPGSELIFDEPMYIYSVAPTEISLPEIPEAPGDAPSIDPLPPSIDPDTLIP